MNLLEQLSARLHTSEKHIAILIEQRADGTWVAHTLSGGVVLLKATTQALTANSQVYYDRTTGQIIAPAASVAWSEFGV